MSNPCALAVSPIGDRGRFDVVLCMYNDHIMRFAKYQGTLRVEKAIDLLTGRVIELYVCFNCGRHSECVAAIDGHRRLIETPQR